MRIRFFSVAVAAVAAAALLLGACGGGGGDNGGNSGSGGGNGSLTLSTSTMTFSATSLTVAPLPQTVSATVTGNIGGTLYIRIVVTGPAVSNVTDVTATGNNTGQATVLPQLPQVLGPGTHTATITVTACTSNVNCTSGIIGAPQTINVSYTINVATVESATLGYVIIPTSPDADFVKSLQVTANPPWTISSASSALALAPAGGGNLNGTVTVTLSRAAADALSPGVVNTQLTLTNAMGRQVTIPVSIDIRRPLVYYASPHVEPSAGAGGTTILRGAGLDVAGGFIGASFVNSGGIATPASNLQISSPTTMQVQRPALAAGTYSLRVLTSAGVNIAQPTAKIVVVDTLAAAAATIAYPVDARPRRVTDLVFDAERSALVLGMRYGTDETASQVLRYTYASGWSQASVRATAYLSSLAPRTDGSGWLATAMSTGGAGNSLLLCQPDFASCTDDSVPAAGAQRLTAIGMTNDGDPIILSTPEPSTAGAGQAWRYSLQRGQLRGFTVPNTYDALLAASDNGAAVLIGSRAIGAGITQPMQYFNVLSGTLTAISMTTTVDRLVIDGRGDKAVVNGSLVFDPHVMTQTGMLPSTTLGAVLSRDGSRAFTWDQNGTIRTFNTINVPATPATLYPEIMPAITPAGDPGAGVNGASLRMALSPDSRTLFLAGSAQIVVQPLP